jgi:uncharacterized protein YehS (DUF1456 family)
MHNNEILRRLADVLTLKENGLAEIFALGGETMTGADALARTLDLDTEGAVPCTSDELGRFLDGLILEKRGPSDTKGPARRVRKWSHNAILKKLRIAFNLTEDDMLRILDAGGSPTTHLALSPLFRKPGNKHYRTCTDAVLDSFLSGLAGESNGR